MEHNELLAWAAGFIDGEGTISMYKRTDRRQEFRVRMSVVNTHKQSLERLQALFGGSIKPLHKDTPLRNWKPSFTWVIGERLAEAAIIQVLPYLFVKRPQAELALEARQHVGPAGQRRSDSQIQRMEMFLQAFRRLNKKGRVAILAG